MKVKHYIIALVCIFPYFVGVTYSFPQGFRQSQGFNYFNSGRYDLAITAIQGFIDSSAIDLGLACSYLGESYYNLFLSDEDSTKLNRALDSFTGALRRTGMASGLSETDSFRVTNKIGWCKYRLVEINQRIGYLEEAKDYFEETVEALSSRDPGEELKSYYIRALLMVVQTNMRMAQAYRVKAQEEIDEEGRPRSAERFLEFLEDAKDTLGMLSQLNLGSRFQNLINLLNKDIDFEKGKFFQSVDGAIFNRLASADSARLANADSARYGIQDNSSDSTAVYFFKKCITDGRELSKLRLDEIYYNLLASFNIDLILSTDDSREFLTEFRGRSLDVYNLRLGNLEQGRINFRDLDELLRAYFSIDYYRNVLSRIAQNRLFETYYWSGWIHLIKGNSSESRSKFGNYIDQFKENIVVKDKLLNDARLRKISMNLEEVLELYYRQHAIRVAEYGTRIADSDSELVQLENLPGESRVFRDQLKILAYFEKRITEEEMYDIYDIENEDILELFRHTEYYIRPEEYHKPIQKQLELIHVLVVKGMLTRGILAKRYLSMARKILQALRPEIWGEYGVGFRDQYHFYFGIASAGLATVTEDEERAEGYYTEATEKLSQIQPGSTFYTEGQYLSGLCPIRLEKYDATTFASLIHVINAAHSLRATRYLGDCLRLRGGREIEAAKCYLAVIMTAGDRNGTPYLNSKATFDDFPFQIREDASQAFQDGVHSISVDGSLVHLDSLTSEEEYPRDEQGRQIAFEKIGDKLSLKLDLIRSSVVLLKKYGLPKMSFYPISRKPTENPFGLRFFPTMEGNDFAVINEVTGPQFSELVMRLHFPSEIRTANAKIYFDSISDLNEIPFNSETKEARIDSVEFNSTHKIIIDGKGCYKIVDEVTFEKDQIVKEYLLPKNLVYDDPKELKIPKDKFDDVEDLSPEALKTEDSEGSVYASDWDNHTVGIYDGERKVLTFGSYGTNQIENNLEKARLIFPTGIAIEEDTTGTEVEGKRLYREKHIIVSDWNGVHKFSKGHYLDSPFIARENQKGFFSVVAIEGYGKDSKLLVFNRNNGKIMEIVGR